jgi:hypothetical protein
MTWEAIAAFGSVASAVILLIAAVAAVIQIKHLRLANQLECYLQLMQELNSRDVVEARRFIESADFNDPEALRAATEPELDDRIRHIATHFQSVARLLNLGVLDEEMFAGHVATAAPVWKALRPVYRVMRERTGMPVLADLEYLADRTARDEQWLTRYMKRYPREFVERSGIGQLLMKGQPVGDAVDGAAGEI